jgi:dTDP-4-amino-4,6-dideoxygalactose transaminase
MPNCKSREEETDGGDSTMTDTHVRPEAGRRRLTGDARDELGFLRDNHPSSFASPRMTRVPGFDTAPDLATFAVLGGGPVASALAGRMPAAVAYVDEPVTTATAFPSAACWIVLTDLSDTAGGRCWLRAGDLLLAAARIAEARQSPDVDVSRVVFVVIGASGAMPDRVDAADVAERDLDELRIAARGPVAPWIYEAVARRLVGGCDSALGGSLDCRADDHLLRAIAIASSLVADAAWVCVPEVVAPFAAGPWMSWARRFGADEPDTAAATVDSLIEAVREAMSAGDRTADITSLASAPVSDIRTAAAGSMLSEKEATQDPREPIPVVVPPRPIRPSEVAHRQQSSLWSGKVKHGNLWTTELTTRLADLLAVDDDQQLLTVATGTAGLRMAFESAVGRQARGEVAVLPAFTFAATAEALLQMGYRLRLADVDPDTWNLDPAALENALAPGDVTMAVTVDALGAPCDHAALRTIASRHGVPLVADSAAALGSRHRGGPVAGWQVAHAYSLSFAKTMTAGGAGGVVVVQSPPEGGFATNWPRSSMMTEIHAITALDQLDAMDDIIRRRQRVATAYDAVLAAHRCATRQKVRIGDQHSWVHYCVRLPHRAGRDFVADALARRGIQTKPYYAPALNDPSWLHRFDSGYGPAEWSDLSVTTSLAETVLAIPMSSELSAAQESRVVEALDSALGELERAD